MAGLTKEQRAQRAAEKAAKEADERKATESAPAEEAAREAGAVDFEITVEGAGDQVGAKTLARDGDGEPSAATEEPDLTGLVLMVKDGETLPVHPTCVRAHINAGWKAVE